MKFRKAARRSGVKFVVSAMLMLAALLLAPLAASAQTDINNDGVEDPLDYPGPFGNDPSELADSTDEDTVEEGDDEVLGKTAFQDSANNANHEEQDLDVSIDDVSRHIGNSFVAPDIQPSSDPATAGAGGTTGGLAVTGSDIEPILAISVGLMAVGGSVLVSSRRRLRDIFF